VAPGLRALDAEHATVRLERFLDLIVRGAPVELAKGAAGGSLRRWEGRDADRTGTNAPDRAFTNVLMLRQDKKEEAGHFLLHCGVQLGS
jgi:hypothetical protein